MTFIAIVALATFSTVVFLMSNDLTDIDSSKLEIIDIPDEFRASYLMSYNVTVEKNGIVEVGATNEFDLYGDGSELVTVTWNSFDKSNLYLVRRYGSFLWVFKNYENLKPFPLSWVDIKNDYDEAVNSTTYYMPSEHNEFIVTVYYNNTLYDNITHSYDNNDLFMNIGKGTTLDPNSQGAWAILSSILTWTNPDIHPAVNFMIAIPMYALMGIIGFFLFKAFIEAVKPFG